MSNLQVLFEVPRHIETGLATGQLQRVGGVIVDSQSRQIVTWLRDSNILESTVEHVMTGSSPLNVIFDAANTAISLYDNHATRKAINVLTSNVNMLAKATLTGQVMNLAITGISFQVIIKQLDNLSTQLEELSQQISQEFEHEREMRFKIALQAARDVFDSSNPELSLSASRSAINGLFEARENFLKSFNDVMLDDTITEKHLIAQQYLIRAFYAEVTRIKCYIQSGDYQLAISRLRDDKIKFEQATKSLVSTWCGQYPSIYFHRDVPSEVLERFLRIQQWLKDDSYRKQSQIIFEIIDELRTGFWNTDVTDSNIIHRVRGTTVIDQQKIEELSNNLLQAEILIENLDRLNGFELEISQMRLSLDDWQHIINEAEDQSLGIIVDMDYLERLQNLSS